MRQLQDLLEIMRCLGMTPQVLPRYPDSPHTLPEDRRTITISLTFRELRVTTTKTGAKGASGWPCCSQPLRGRAQKNAVYASTCFRLYNKSLAASVRAH